MAFWRLKRFFQRAAAIAAALFLALFLLAIHSSRLPQTEVRADRREYYLYSASSQAQIRETYDFSEWFCVEGECAFYSSEEICKRFAGGEARSAFKDDLIETTGATVCFEEEICGTRSYYCYSPQLRGGVILNGFMVNLHIAARENSVAVGSPVVFGGY